MREYRESSENRDGELEAHLAEIWAAYRSAMPDPEPSANFTAHLWRRIEQRQPVWTGFRRFGPMFATAAACLCLLTVALGSRMAESANSNSVSRVNYVEVLADDPAPEGMEYAELVPVDFETERYSR
jgi:hypothetical protein